jgi:glyoxylase-like metal-dependent hydrolase (beta-lactamase superfamily II)
MTLDAAASRASIQRLRALAATDPSNVIVCGHDRLLGLEGDKVLYLSELRATVSASVSSEFERDGHRPDWDQTSGGRIRSALVAASTLRCQVLAPKLPARSRYGTHY